MGDDVLNLALLLRQGSMRAARHAPPAPGSVRMRRQAGIGNTGFACANFSGRITLMSLSSTCVLTGAAPWFWPLTNLVGPYGITWPAKVEAASASVSLARSAAPARRSASAVSSTAE